MKETVFIPEQKSATFIDAGKPEREKSMYHVLPILDNLKALFFLKHTLSKLFAVISCETKQKVKPT